MGASTSWEASAAPGFRFDAALIFEALATGSRRRRCISIHDLCRLDDRRLRLGRAARKLLPALRSMELLDGYCLTEPGAGSDAAAPRRAPCATATITCSTARSSSSPAPAHAISMS